ncbi:MAG: DHH family phosphoesterase [bacterium]
MSLTTNQQIYESIKRSRHILIVFRHNFNGDALGSALALFLILKKLDKRADLAAMDFDWPKNLIFLPQEKILPALTNLKKYTISLDLKGAQIDELSYEIAGQEKLAIHLTPKNGTLSQQDISLQENAFKYDLIIAVDTPDLELLGKIYEDNASFFYQTPVINIDHSPANENYGQINLVDLTATSSAEIIFNWLEAMSLDFLDEKIATCLLAGLIAETRSFKTRNVTPRALQIASRLMAAGANRSEIVENLYRARTLATLKLWGRALTRLENDPSLKLAWSLLGQADFLQAGAGEENLFELIDELIANSPEAEIIVLFYEQKDDQICCLINCQKESDTNVLAKFFSPKVAGDLIRFCLTDKNLIQAKEEIIGEISRILEAKNKGKII